MSDFDKIFDPSPQKGNMITFKRYPPLPDDQIYFIITKDCITRVVGGAKMLDVINKGHLKPTKKSNSYFGGPVSHAFLSCWNINECLVIKGGQQEIRETVKYSL